MVSRHASATAQVVVETCTDLVTWTEQSSAISVMPVGSFETTLPLNGALTLFVRLREVSPANV